jgi:gp16 family phage-associated protein
MTANEIRAELIRQGITGVDIARKAGCSKQYVSAIIKGKRKNERIQGIISSYINKPVSEIWTDTG